MDTDQRTHKQFVEKTADLFAVDRRHIHVSGFSLGSYATWKMLAESSALVCSIAAAEFPPYAHHNPTGDGCTAGIGPIWTWDGPPTCFARESHCGGAFHKRSIMWAFGHHDTICNGDLNLVTHDRFKRFFLPAFLTLMAPCSRWAGGKTGTT